MMTDLLDGSLYTLTIWSNADPPPSFKGSNLVAWDNLDNLDCKKRKEKILQLLSCGINRWQCHLHACKSRLVNITCDVDVVAENSLSSNFAISSISSLENKLLKLK